MSLEVSVQVTKDTAGPRLRRLASQLTPRKLGAIVGPPLAEYWRDHLASLPRNKHGYPSTGFWEAAARSVSTFNTDEGAVLRCSKLGVRQRYHGGTISAKSGKYLTIPICADAYGKTAAEFNDELVPVRLADGRWFLAQWNGDGDKPKAVVFRGSGGGAADLGRTERKGDLKFMFRLVESVEQEGDPDVVPGDMARVAKEVLRRELVR